MTEIIEPLEALEVVAYGEPLRGNEVSRSRILTAATLGVVAAADILGVTSSVVSRLPGELPHIVSYVAFSSAHPVLGYSGAWLADAMTKGSTARFRVRAMALAATIVNFSGETAQSLLLASSEYANFLAPRNIPETFRDYVFALGGMALFWAQARRSESKVSARHI